MNTHGVLLVLVCVPTKPKPLDAWALETPETLETLETLEPLEPLDLYYENIGVCFTFGAYFGQISHPIRKSNFSPIKCLLWRSKCNKWVEKLLK